MFIGFEPVDYWADPYTMKDVHAFVIADKVSPRLSRFSPSGPEVVKTFVSLPNKRQVIMTVYFKKGDHRIDEKEAIVLIRELSKTSGGMVLSSGVVEGHASPEGSEEYNYKLGLRRAESLKSLITDVLGQVKMDVFSYGESECREKREYWPLCRKAEFKGEFVLEGVSMDAKDKLPIRVKLKMPWEVTK